MSGTCGTLISVLKRSSENLFFLLNSIDIFFRAAGHRSVRWIEKEIFFYLTNFLMSGTYGTLNEWLKVNYEFLSFIFNFFSLIFFITGTCGTFSDWLFYIKSKEIVLVLNYFIIKDIKVLDDLLRCNVWKLRFSFIYLEQEADGIGWLLRLFFFWRTLKIIGKLSLIQ